MYGKNVLAALILSLVLASSSAAQQPATVQLPTFSFFAVSTTVMVPDSGGAHAGGVSSGNYGTVHVGPGIGPKQRAFGFGIRAAGIDVTAHIHDFRAWEQALEAGAEARRAATRSRDPDVVRLEDNTKGGGDNLIRSVADIRRQVDAAETARNEEARELMAKARAAADNGKNSLAKSYLRIAAAQASGDVRAEALAQLNKLQSTSPR